MSDLHREAGKRYPSEAEMAPHSSEQLGADGTTNQTALMLLSHERRSGLVEGLRSRIHPPSVERCLRGTGKTSWLRENAVRLMVQHFRKHIQKKRVAIFFPRLGGWHDQAYRGGSMRILGQDSHVSPVNREINKQLR